VAPSLLSAILWLIGLDLDGVGPEKGWSLAKRDVPRR
jgi:hypothetical protein